MNVANSLYKYCLVIYYIDLQKSTELTYVGSSPTPQLKIRVPIQVSSTMYQSKIPTEIELNRNEKKQIQQKRSKL